VEPRLRDHGTDPHNLRDLAASGRPFCIIEMYVFFAHRGAPRRLSGRACPNLPRPERSTTRIVRGQTYTGKMGFLSIIAEPRVASTVP